MAGTNRYFHAKNFIKKYFKNNEIVGLLRLRNIIGIYLASQEKAIDDYAKLMHEVGFIEDIGTGQFKIHHDEKEKDNSEVQYLL